MVDYLAVNKPTPIQKLFNEVPKPPGSVPKNGLPIWTTLELGEKLPIVKCPENSFILYRAKLGKKLWLTTTKPDFVLYDPYCYDVSYEYDSLHDPSLKKFFAKDLNFNTLVDNKLVTPLPNPYVVCTLKEFNNYARYLRRIHMVEIQKYQDKVEAANSERVAIANDEETAARNIKGAIRQSRRKQVQKEARMRKLNEAHEIAEKNAQKEQEIGKQMEEYEAMKLERATERAKESKKHNEHRAQKVAISKEIENEARIAAFRNWNMQEKRHKFRINSDKVESKRLRDAELAYRWERKIQIQNRRIQYEQQLNENMDEEMRQNVERRKRKYAAQHKRMKDDLERMKKRRQHRRHKRKCICPDKYGVYDEKCPDIDKLPKIIEDDETDFTEVTDDDKDKDMDGDVAIANNVDVVLNRVICTYVHKKLSNIISGVVHDVIADTKSKAGMRSASSSFTTSAMFHKSGQRCSYQIYRVSTGIHKAIPIGINSNYIAKAGKRKKKTRVSFGNVDNIGESSLLLQPHMQLRSVKNRPPTPVTSLMTFASVCMDDSPSPSPLSANSVGSIMPEREILDQTLLIVKERLKKEVLMKTDSGLDYQTRQLVMAHRASWSDVGINQITERLTNAVMRLDIDDLLSSPEIKFASEALACEILEIMEHQTHERRQISPKVKYFPDPTSSTSGSARIYSEARNQQEQIKPSGTNWSTLFKSAATVVLSKILPRLGGIFKFILTIGMVLNDEDPTQDASNSEMYSDSLINSIPNVVPCINGKEIQIDPTVAAIGLSALSIKHDDNALANCKLLTSGTSVTSQSFNTLSVCVQKDIIQSRNSFWSVHRPELRKLSWTKRLNQQEIVAFIEEHVAVGDHSHENKTAPSGNRNSSEMKCLKDFRSNALIQENDGPLRLQGIYPEGPEMELNPVHGPRAYHITDEDLSEEYQVHKSYVGMCIDMGHCEVPPCPQVFIVADCKIDMNDKEDNSSVSSSPSQIIPSSEDVLSITSGNSTSVTERRESDLDSVPSPLQLHGTTGQSCVPCIPAIPSIPAPPQLMKAIQHANNIQGVTVLLPPRNVLSVDSTIARSPDESIVNMPATIEEQQDSTLDQEEQDKI